MRDKEQLLDKCVSEYLEAIFVGAELSQVADGVAALIDDYGNRVFAARPKMDQQRAYLITYGDSIYDGQGNDVPLHTLATFLEKHVTGLISDVHILPMFEYSSDDGFSVIDYMKVNPELGSWQDIDFLGERFGLMFDYVANHLSKQSTWFKHFLAGIPGYRGAFVEAEAGFDVSRVVRPRTSPLFHTYYGKEREYQVWTTFSEDQVDVNFKDPETFLRLTQVLLEYCYLGGSSIRLDAIGFIWKQSGTSCMSLPQAHIIIKFWRTLVDYFCAGTQIITETNVPHEENISYLGNGWDEANQVYQFALPPLVLFTYTTNNAKKLSAWASTIQAPSDCATYFNFLASHDGIGLRPTEGILDEAEKQLLIDKVIANNGLVSYKQNSDGSKSVYELNINYAEALRNENEDDETLIRKALGAHHILLSVVGVPAIYYHSLFGSKNDIEGVEDSGIARRINRKKLEVHQLEMEISADPFRAAIFNGISELLRIRGLEEAFHPYGNQQVLKTDERVFGIKRWYNDSTVICYTNVSGETVRVNDCAGINILTGEEITNGYIMQPYEYMWIKTDKVKRVD